MNRNVHLSTQVAGNVFKRSRSNVVESLPAIYCFFLTATGYETGD